MFGFFNRIFNPFRRLLGRSMGGDMLGSKKRQQNVNEPVSVPEQAPASPPKRQLWGREFDVVAEGLDERQVVAFVEGVTSKCRALEEQQKHFLSLGSLTEKAAIQGDRVAEEIKTTARTEAAAEAARIIAEANRKTQEMLAEAKKVARETTAQEVQSIIHAALRKAGIIELEAKQQAQLFLIRSREAIEEDLKEEAKGAYHRILNALEDLSGTGHRVEMEWKEKTGRLRKVETFELEGDDAVPSALATEIGRTPPLADRQANTDTPTETSRAGAVTN